MLAARRAASTRLGRSFATVVDAAGLKVAAVDAQQPTSSITVLVKAGSRYETKPGVAHALKNFAFKSTASRSALGTVRESELYGGVLSSSLSREHLALTAEFLRGDESYFVDVLSSFLTSAKFTRHEFEEYVIPVIQSESQFASGDPATAALEIAHALAFRSGLGSSLFANAHSPLSVADVKSYASSVFTKDNIAILGTGISQEALAALSSKALASIATSAAPKASTSSYFGGESRLEAHGGPQTVFIGFGTTGAPSAELAALAAHLSPPAVKWATPDLAYTPVYLPYSDATLFGLLVQGETAAKVKENGQKAVQALKAAAKGLKAEDVKRAVVKARFESARNVEGRDGLVNVLGSKVLLGTDATVEATLSTFDKVTAAGFSKAATSLLNSKPTFVAVGDVSSLPYADELGL